MEFTINLHKIFKYFHMMYLSNLVYRSYFQVIFFKYLISLIREIQIIKYFEFNKFMEHVV